MAGPTPGPGPAQPPAGGGNIDVKPSSLWNVSGQVAGQQDPMMRGGNTLVRELQEHPDAGGAGTSAEKFAQAYKKIGNRWLEVLGKSVVSIGGVAVGFTETANAYTKADAAAHPKPGQAPEQRPLPTVIDKDPKFASVPDIKWGDDDGGDDLIRGAMEGIPEIVRDLLQPVAKHVFRVGKVADVHPFPQQHYLNSHCHSWMNASTVPGNTAAELTRIVGIITNHQRADWEAAMRTFCSALWGATDWGKSRHGVQWAHTSPPSGGRTATGSQPVMAVLADVAIKISDCLREYSEAAVELNHDVFEELKRAMKQAAMGIIDDLEKAKEKPSIKSIAGAVTSVASGIGGATGLLLKFDVNTVLKLDKAKLNRIVDKYTGIVDGLTTRMEALQTVLDEAHMSAPKFEAGVARAHAFGSRSLNDFKHEQQWTVPGSNGNMAFDLAANEYLGGGHTLDKHVGKTDEQLAQRLRDQSESAPTWPESSRPTIGGSSSFKTIGDAQRLTEQNLRLKQSEIDAWLASNPQDGQNMPFVSQTPNGEVSGSYVSKQQMDNQDGSPGKIPGTGYKDHGLKAPAVDVTWVKTVLKYDSRLDPPYIIYTSMPAPRPKDLPAP
ncbi:RNase A-like domain-containing protein [Streptomyces virginiae]|uniref:Bacterial CdiA-CT RNAse A domain-containing protein n=1 Tax=Streptomyces virginiae TaxID=1961 RepID=A0ABZ1TCQ1_STRVG|nr:RNase A-like domain-containing protein [Streptomyces virginiae]